MSQAHSITRLSVAEYLAAEQLADVRHEYIDGELFAMAGASRRHATIVLNVAAAIHQHLSGTPCRAAVSDMKVWIESANRFYYPDIVISCSGPGLEPDAHYDNQPKLVIEVLSESTAALDRREKRLAYQQLESLEEYVLIDQKQQRVDVYRRSEERWTHVQYDHETVRLASIDLALPTGLVYQGS